MTAEAVPRCENSFAMVLKPPIPPMETRSVEEIPAGEGWQYEPKWDGFRCLAFRDGNEIFLQSKNGQPLARYFPDVADAVGKIPSKQFVLDGELVIPVGGALSFDELQLRLHPAASRVRRLAAAHPAVYIVFDLLGESGESFVKLNLKKRRQLLDKFARSNLKSAQNIRLSPATTDYRVATAWFKKTGRDLDGIIAKQLDAAYASGERTAAVKVKRIRTADCVVGGFRYATGKRVIGSLLRFPPRPCAKAPRKSTCCTGVAARKCRRPTRKSRKRKRKAFIFIISRLPLRHWTGLPDASPKCAASAWNWASPMPAGAVARFR